MKSMWLAGVAFSVPLAAFGQGLQTNSLGGMTYYELPAAQGCSTSAPCNMVVLLHYMDEQSGDLQNDVQQYFGGSFQQQNPHTIVVAPFISQPQDSDIDWGGYNSLTSPQQKQMVAIVQSVEQQNAGAFKTGDVVVTGGSLGGNGTLAALIEYGPKGQVQPGVFAAGASFDAALYNWASDPATKTALCGVPLLDTHGTADTEQPYQYSQDLANNLSGCQGYTLNPIQGAGHGTWGGSSGLAAGTGSGTPLAWITSELNSVPAAGTAPSTAAATPVAQAAPATSKPATTAATQPASQPAPAATAASAASTGTKPAQTTVQQDVALAEAEIKVAQMQMATSSPNALLIGALLDDAVQRLDDAQTQMGAAPSVKSSPSPSTSATAQPVASAGTSLPAVSLPAVSASVCDLASSGQFAAMGDTIYGPNQQPFIARGINIMEGQQPSVDEVEAAFPGVNFIRYAIYDYADPATISAYIKQFTDKGIVVELEDHSSSDGQDRGGGTGEVFTGDRLTQELNWYSSVATAFKDNPYVWYGTDNEPPANDPGALSNWQLQTYQAVRSTGNNAPVMLEATSWGPGQTNVGYDASDYAGMTNTIWDVHSYQWIYGNDDAAAIAPQLAGIINDTQAIPNAGGPMPIIIGEYGNSTTGDTIDDNGNVAAVEASGVGSAAWAWGSGNPGDGLTDGDSPSSPYGQQVASFIAQGGASGTTSQAVACASSTSSSSASASSPAAKAGGSASVTPQNSLASIPMPAMLQSAEN